MSALLARWRHACGREDEGLGLAELVVTMFLGTLVLVILGTTFAATRGTVTGVSARTQNSQQERTAINALTKSLRAAEAPAQALVWDTSDNVPPGSANPAVSATTAGLTAKFCSAAATSVLFYANIVPGHLPSLVRYSVDATGNLIEQVQVAPSKTDVAPCTTSTFSRRRIIANNVQTSSGVFTYLKQDGSALPLAAGVLPAASFPSLDSIGISLSIATPTNPVVPATTVKTQVYLPNVTGS